VFKVVDSSGNVEHLGQLTQ